jgi:hypothetical protein
MAEVKDTREIKEIGISHGADLIGIADLGNLNGLFTYPKGLSSRYRRGISVVVNLDRFDEYDNLTEDNAFLLLNHVASQIKNFIKSRGYKARIIAPDKRVRQKGPSIGWEKFPIKLLQRLRGLDG